MIDRLGDFHKLTNFKANDHNSQDGMELRGALTQQRQEGVEEEFLQEIKEIEAMIADLESNSKRIHICKDKYSKASKSSVEKESSTEMNSILSQNTVIHKKIKEKMSVIEEQVERATKQQPDQPETRMKKNFHTNISKKVGDALEKQQSSESEYKNMVKAKVTRQVRLNYPDIKDDELEGYVNDPDAAQEMLEKRIFGQASISLKNTVCDIQDKFRDIQVLQRSVNECVALFNELSALVMAQGEYIDSIEGNVNCCKDYVTHAEKKLVQAKQHHNCSKKCLCIGVIIGLVVIIIIIIAVVATK